ncbi:hypothetical protein KL939_004221 [Ogataea angusta]|nr:hypothetical protein KL939_004221 [Ogataea angusta]
MDSESNCKLENKRAVVQTHCPGADGDVWVRGVDKAGQPGSGATHKAHQTSPVHAAGVPINAVFAENVAVRQLDDSISDDEEFTQVDGH